MATYLARVPMLCQVDTSNWHVYHSVLSDLCVRPCVLLLHSVSPVNASPVNASSVNDNRFALSVQLCYALGPCCKWTGSKKLRELVACS